MFFDDDYTIEEKRQRGYLRARDSAYDAIWELWVQRAGEGMTQKDIAAFLDRDPAWVSRFLAGPSNWTMKTLGEMAEALNGVIRIQVDPLESIAMSNFDIYEQLQYDSHQLLTEVPSSMSGITEAVSPVITVTTTQTSPTFTVQGF